MFKIPTVGDLVCFYILILQMLSNVGYILIIFSLRRDFKQFLLRKLNKSSNRVVHYDNITLHFKSRDFNLSLSCKVEQIFADWL